MKHLTARPDLSPLQEPYKSIVGRALAKDPNHRQARVQDMLLPEDAPSPPPVRFIGDAKAPTVQPALLVSEERKDEVMRIGAEEPVFYIGPDTRPPVRPQARRPTPPWRWGVTPLVQAARARRAAARTARASRRAAPPVPVAAAFSPPPPPPPPLPSSRVKLAELATSMLCAAPVTALASPLILLSYGALTPALPADPTQLAFLFVLTLLGTWSVLVPTKFWEGKPVDTRSKRLVMLALGLILGLVGVVLGSWLRLGSTPLFERHGLQNELAAWSEPLGTRQNVVSLAFAGFFGLALALNGWWKLTSRDRPARFRFLPLILAAVISGAIGWILGAPPQPWGLMVITLIAIVAQIVSPWNRAAAEYARTARRRQAA
jgi:hypothetical protein